MARLRYKTYTDKVIEATNFQWIAFENIGTSNITLYDIEGNSNILKPDRSTGTGTPDNDTYDYVRIDCTGGTVQLQHDGGIFTEL